MTHYVYILRSLKDGKHYIGETADVAARLAFHNAGLQTSAKGRIPFELVYVETRTDRVSALKREKQIKGV